MYTVAVSNLSAETCAKAEFEDKVEAIEFARDAINYGIEFEIGDEVAVVGNNVIGGCVVTTIKYPDSPNCRILGT